jgi:hypothetical protein
VIILVVVFASPLARLFVSEIVVDELHPERISWNGKTAWKRCDSAIAKRTSWPAAAGEACAAMSMCTNEAPLTDRQKQTLAQAIRDTPGCQP